MTHKIRQMVISALMAALICVATMIIKIPSPLKGYINLGDCVVLVAGWALSPVWGFLAAGLGSALADTVSGYLVYAPVTFFIKGLMAVFACCGFGFLHKRLGNTVSEIISGIGAEIWMILGYYVFEGFMYGFVPAAVNIPANGVQGAAGIIIGVALMNVLGKTKLTLK